jgi:hypothetical protein
METFIRRMVSVILFIILFFSGLTLIEIICYSIRYFVKGTYFPINPYAFEFLSRMW